MTSRPVESAQYESLEGEQRSASVWSLTKTKVIAGTAGVLTLLVVGAVVAGLMVNVGHRESCQDTYWRRSCRLVREGEGREGESYNNFLARAGLLLPATVHQILSAEEMGRGRVLVVGDIHGCRDEFLELLDKAKFERGADTLILTGDLVDKGPYSIQVVKEARKLGALSVRGNHDDSALAAYEEFTRGHEVEEKHEWVKDLEADDAAWMANLPWTISLPSHSITVVHAGLVPEIPLKHQLLPDLYHMREVGPGDDTKWRGIEGKPRGQGKPWAGVWDGPQHVVFGHDSHRGLQEEAFATGIDTALVSGEYLTGLLLPGAKDLQVKQVGIGKGGGPMTLDKLHGKIIQVKAKKDYLDS